MSQLPYSAKFWQGNTLVNLANQSYFANVLPLQNLSLTLPTPIAHQFAKVFPRQNFMLYGISLCACQACHADSPLNAEVV